MPHELITSTQNPRVKRVAKLRERRDRQRQGRFLIEGSRELSRAVEAGLPIEEAFVCPARCRDRESQQALHLLQSQPQVEVVHVTELVMKKLVYGERESGVVAVARSPRHSLQDLNLPTNPLLAVLERVEKPGNLGAVLRSADGAGVDALIAADPQTDLYNPNTIRASLGTVFGMQVCVAGAAETLQWLVEHGLRVAAARVDATCLYTEFDFRQPTAIVLGSEAAGLSGAWQSDQISAIRLPMLGAADSLNVSAAAAVLFYEARRQRSCE